MTEHHDLDRQLNAFLLDGPTSLPDSSFDAVRDRTEQTRQRVVLGPWRVPTLNKLVPIGLGTAALVVALLLGSRFIGSPSSNVGGPASQPPASAAPTAAAASIEPTTSPEPPPSQPVSPPPLTQSFTSPLHGISLSYPEGWTAQAATEPWTDGPNSHSFDDPQADHLVDPTLDEGHLELVIASQPIGDASPDEWMAAQMAGDERCTATEPIAVGEASGLMSEGCNLAVVTTDGRGYWILLRASDDDPAAVAPYDRAWFEEVLATVQLHPEDAVDAAR
jgi:hypothetical protein